jgi:hypothetical protein
MLTIVTRDLGESNSTERGSMINLGFAHLEVVRLGRHDWRVSDGRLDQNDPTRLLGFVERPKTDA